MWFSPLKALQRFFFRTPLVHLFIMGSEAYHDYYRWPARDRAVFEAWQRDSPWGALFTRYQQQGHLADTEMVPAGM